jgi:hypothetical protein
MRRPALIAFTAAAAAAACVPGGPIYVGPPPVTLQGLVFSLEDQRPLANAEVCVFGTDTLCLASDLNGEYKAQMRDIMLLEGQALTVRFRPQGYPPAFAKLTDIEPGEVTRVDCGVSSRLTLSAEPATCFPLER